MMASENNRRIGGRLFHVVVWAALLALPLFSLLPGRHIIDGNAYVHYLVAILSFMAVFYANWSFLIRKYLYPRRIGLFVLWNFLLILAVIMLGDLFFRLVLPPPPAEQPDQPQELMNALRLMFVAGNMFLYALVVLVCVAIRMTQEWYKADNQRKDLEKSRTEAELQNLKSQLNPHFLFNTLNNIYSLIQIDGNRAQEAVHDLSQLLRYVLYDSAQATVPVQKEMAFLQDYIALMRIRLPRHVDLQLSLPQAPSARAIAPMLFISPIENAFKHGVSNEETSFIQIAIEEKEGSICCHIRNSNFPKADDDRSGSGIGIKNLEQRLQMIYPGRYRFTHGASDGVYETFLEVPL